MRIFHIITGLGDGGAEATLYRLCQYDQTNHHSVVALMGRGKYADKLEEIGVSVVTLGIPRGGLAVLPFFRLFNLMRQSQPDVVQTWMYHADLMGGLVARAAGIKTVVWGVRQSRLDPPFAKKTTLWTAKLLAYFSKVVPRRIITCASEALDLHVMLGYHKSKMRYVPNGYPLEKVCLDAVVRRLLRAKLQVPEKKCVLGMVGSFKPFKDHKNLLNALSIVKSRGHLFECWLVGSGVTRENHKLLNWINERDLAGHIVLLGQRDDVPAVMNAIDLHVLSSTTEGFPNVVAEAMACGTPCVVTEVGDAPHIVGDTGWTVPRHDSEALADAMEIAIKEMSNAHDWEQRGKAARARIEQNFSIERMVAAYVSVWEEARLDAEK